MEGSSCMTQAFTVEIDRESAKLFVGGDRLALLRRGKAFLRKGRKYSDTV